MKVHSKQAIGSTKSPLQMPQIMKSFCVTACVPNASYGSCTEWKTSTREVGDIVGEVGITCCLVQASCGCAADDMVGVAECAKELDLAR